ncbi:MAG: DUF3025 domain-containing protein [Polyangiaceae bacterium]|nr:DUF3025 domain-containing protein [Polyangiaceae bacterium]
MSTALTSSSGLRPLERGHPWDARFFERNPLHWPLRAVAQSFEGFADWPTIAEIDAALSERAGIHFQEQPPRARRRRRGRRLPLETESLYDARIQLSGWVPTRHRNWHDFLNALVWATFPRAKKAFHARQHAAVAARIEQGARVLPGARTRELDGLAILDEGGMVLLVEEPIELHITEWIEDDNREIIRAAIAERRAVALLFGHALYETLLGENASATWAMVTLLPCPAPLPDSRADQIVLADERLADRIALPDSFSDPDTFRNLPLDTRVLCV